MLSLTVQSRAKETSEALAQKGLVPAVFYGPKESSTPISLEGRELNRVYKVAGETTLVTLNGLGEPKETLIHDVQFHPVTGNILHVDFYVLEKGKKVKLAIPLEFIGTAPAEKLGFIVVKTMHTLEIEVAANEIPKNLTVDLSKLAEEHDRVLAKDLQLPASATLVGNADEIVAAVTTVKEVKETAPVAAPEAAPAAGAAAPAPEKK